MHRRTVRVTLSLLFAALLVACGDREVSDGRKTATTGAASASDAATVTAFAINRSSSTASKGTRTVGIANVFATPNLVIGTAVSGPPSGATVVVGNTYTDPRGRFQFTIPQGWQAESDSNADVLVVPPLLRGGLQLVIVPIDAATTLDEYTGYVIQATERALGNFQLTPNSEKSLTIDGQPARRFEFSSAVNGLAIRYATYVVKDGVTAYTLVIAAVPADFDAVLRQASIAVNTLTFLA